MKFFYSKEWISINDYNPFYDNTKLYLLNNIVYAATVNLCFLYI